MSNTNNFKTYLEYSADGHSIYVFGAQGDDLTAMTPAEREAFIRKREHGNEVNINRDLALYARKVAEGYEFIQAFDCSGLIMYFLQNLTQAVDFDTTAQGIYNICDYHPSLNELKPFDIVFNGSDEKHITHCGVYMGNNDVIEARGRDYGVVHSAFDKRPWSFYGHLQQLDAFIPVDDHPELRITKPLTKGEHIAELQRILNMYKFDCGSVDGKYGKKTEKALKDFCRYYGG